MQHGSTVGNRQVSCINEQHTLACGFKAPCPSLIRDQCCYNFTLAQYIYGVHVDPGLSYAASAVVVVDTHSKSHQVMRRLRAMHCGDAATVC